MRSVASGNSQTNLLLAFSYFKTISPEFKFHKSTREQKLGTEKDLQIYSDYI